MATPTAREVVWLVALVIALDALFIGIYFLGHVSGASDTTKLAFTVVWTLAVLIIVVRGLSRIRSTRLSSAGKERPN